MFKVIRFIKLSSSFLKIAGDPSRLNEVFSLADAASSKEVLGMLREEFRARHGRGTQALQERRRLAPLDLDGLARLPQGTLGQVFAHHMRSNGLEPEAIPTLDASDELEFIRAHLYETHDIWHVVTGFRTDVAGELGLQAFYLAQFNGPLPAAILAAGLLNGGFKARADMGARMDAIAAGWQMGKKAGMLFGACWDDLWATPIEEVRASLGVQALEDRSAAA